MTQILNSQVQARLELEQVNEEIYQLRIMKSRKASVVVITQAEALSLQRQFNLIIQKPKSDGTNERV